MKCSLLLFVTIVKNRFKTPFSPKLFENDTKTILNRISKPSFFVYSILNSTNQPPKRLFWNVSRFWGVRLWILTVKLYLLQVGAGASTTGAPCNGAVAPRSSRAWQATFWNVLSCHGTMQCSSHHNAQVTIWIPNVWLSDFQIKESLHSG